MDDTAAQLLFFAIVGVVAIAYYGIPARTKTVGIDLGTTFSLAAYMDPNTRSMHLVPSVSSVITYFPNKTHIVGYTQFRRKSPKNTIFEAKRFIGRTFEEVNRDLSVKKDGSHKYYPFKIVPLDNGKTIGFYIPAIDQVVDPIEVGLKIVKELQRRVDLQLGHKMARNVVIATPAEFTPLQKEFTAQVFERAGYRVTATLDEPTAAAMAYGLHRQKNVNYVLVYDWGGGTLDIALLWIKNGNVQLLNTDGDRDFGGANIDQCLFDLLRAKLPQNDRKCPTHTLLSIAEETKIKLSKHDKANVRCGRSIYTVYRKDFEKHCETVLDRAMFSLERLLDESKVKTRDIDAVVLVGGSTRIPSLRSRLTKFFGGKKPLTDIDPDTAVAIGCARASED